MQPESDFDPDVAPYVSDDLSDEEIASFDGDFEDFEDHLEDDDS